MPSDPELAKGNGEASGSGRTQAFSPAPDAHCSSRLQLSSGTRPPRPLLSNLFPRKSPKGEQPSPGAEAPGNRKKTGEPRQGGTLVPQRIAGICLPLFRRPVAQREATWKDQLQREAQSEMGRSP